MKSKLIILISLILIPNFAVADDYKEYEKIVSYIQADSSDIKSFLLKNIDSTTNFNLCINNKIQFITNFIFIDQIIHYEFMNKNKEQISILYRDSIYKHLDSIEYYSEFVEPKIDFLNKGCCCSLILFVSRSIENKIKVILFRFNNKYETYREYLQNSNRFLGYLFYFNNDKIEHVLFSTFYD